MDVADWARAGRRFRAGSPTTRPLFTHGVATRFLILVRKKVEFESRRPPTHPFFTKNTQWWKGPKSGFEVAEPASETWRM